MNKKNQELKIDEELKNLFPPLTEEEFNLLEKNILRDGCSTPLTTWNGIIIDGHNRYNICTKHNIEFKTGEIAFLNKDDVICWMIDTQIGRRNLPDFVKFELKKKKIEILKADGKKKMSEDSNKWRDSSGFSTMEKPEDVHDTHKVIAEELGWGKGAVGRANVVDKKAAPEVKEKLRKGEVSINKAYNDIKKEEELKRLVKTNENFINTKPNPNPEQNKPKEKKIPLQQNPTEKVMSNEEYEEIVRAVKDPDVRADKFEDALNEVNGLKESCDNFIWQFNLKYFTELKYAEKLNAEQKIPVINAIDNFIEQLNELKIKLTIEKEVVL